MIYFFYNRETPIYLLMVYANGISENISPGAKKMAGSSLQESSWHSVAMQEGEGNE